MTAPFATAETLLRPGPGLLAPAHLPASPPRRWWRRRRPWQWQPSDAQLGAARALALEITCALTCAQNYRDPDYVARRGAGISAWLTGGLTEPVMAARYAAARQALACVNTPGGQWTPEPDEFTTVAARYALFILAV